MKIDPDAHYVVRINFTRHNKPYSIWSQPMRGNHCCSSNIQRTTVEEMGQFLASMHFKGQYDSVEVYILPTVPVLKLAGPMSEG